MRYFEFTIRPDGGAIHAVDRVIAETPSIMREALVHVNALGNGTGVMLYRLRGDPEELDSQLEGHPDLISSALVDVEGETFHFYVHVKPGQPAGQLMAVAQKYALMIVPPLPFTDGGLRITVVGTHEMLRQALEEFSDEIRISVEQVGPYSPDGRNVLSLLTDRQLEVFETAVGKGVLRHSAPGHPPRHRRRSRLCAEYRGRTPPKGRIARVCRTGPALTDQYSPPTLESTALCRGGLQIPDDQSHVEPSRSPWT